MCDLGMFCATKKMNCKGWRCYSPYDPVTAVCIERTPNWDFVNCNQQGQVTQFVANGLGLTGVLPDGIGALRANTIFLMQNIPFIFRGSIPSALGSLSKLTTLSLFNNRLTGSIPTELGGLVSLRQLYLGGNQFEGTVPAQLCGIPNLDVLSFPQNNNLTCYALCLSKILVQDFGATPQC